MTRVEKTFLLVILLTLPLLAIKSLALDGYEALPSEEGVVALFEERVAERYDHVLYDLGILQIKMIDLTILTMDERPQWVAKYRKYLLGIFPFFDVYMKEVE